MLIGEKIILRPINKNDWKKTLAWRNDFNLKQMIVSHPFPITEELELDWYEKILLNKGNNSIYFSIVEKDDDKLIGLLFLTDINWISGTCKFHIFIGDENCKGKGYGKESLSLIIKYVFYSLNLRKITLEVLSVNAIAKNLYVSMGFFNEGLLKRHFYCCGDYLDIEIMSLIKN